MPPLQAPPDDDWDAVADEDPRGGRGKWVWLSAALVLLLLLVGGTWYLLSDVNRGPGDAAAGTSTARTSATPTGIQLDPAAFIGRPADEVQKELEAAGLTVTQKDADDAELASAGTALDAGDVAGLRPSGVLAVPGTAVVLYVAQKAYDPAHQGNTPTPTTAAKTTATQTTTAAPTTTSEPTTPPPTTTPLAPGTSEPPPSSPTVDPGAPAASGAG
jgi:serine/threonine-protein kinase